MMTNKIICGIAVVCVFMCGSLKAQGSLNKVTMGGHFDRLSDRFGNNFEYYNLNTESIRPLGRPLSSGVINAVPTLSCQAGYFILYFAQGSYLAGSSSAQSVVCQVFSDISSFINVPAPLSIPFGSVKIHIYCSDLSGPGLAKASSFYLYPFNPAYPLQGYIYSQVEKGMLSGNDPFLNLPVAAFPGSNNFYSGYIDVNPNTAWNLNMNTLTIAANQTDLYSSILHEAFHLLGFSSLINYNGNSKFGWTNNYFSRYDGFLHSSGGAPLLVSQTPSGCPNSNILYGAPSTSILGSPTGTVIDASNCNTAIRYVSPSNNLSVYTPSAYSLLASFSHFEDQCNTPNSFTPAAGCTAGVTPPNTNNNLYYVMSNSVGVGSCYVKRYPTPEEQNVLCDLNYSVNNTYSSSAVIDANSPTTTAHVYMSWGCNQNPTVFGQNDGLLNGVYTFTTTTTSTVIPYSTILANDLPANGLQISCLEAIYSNTNYTAGVSDLSVTAAIGSGLVLFKYLPHDVMSGQWGNPTYIYVYFMSPSCTPQNACNIVENGDFENQLSGSGGYLSPNNSPLNILSCWQRYNGVPEVFVANSLNVNQQYYDLGNNTLYTNPPVSSYNGTVNNTRVVGISYFPSNNYYSSLQNNLASALVPGQVYQVSFWALNHPASTSSVLPFLTNFNNNNQPCVINISAYQNYPVLTPTLNFPNGLVSLSNFTVNASANWGLYTGTFTVPPTTTGNLGNLLIGFNQAQTALIASPSNSSIIYAFIDDISITALPGTTFVIPGASTCGSPGSYTNLAQYSSAVPGLYWGTGVTYSNNISYFNVPPTLPQGYYPVMFSYATNNGCNYSLQQNILVSPPYTVMASSNTFTNCSNFNGSFTLDAGIQPPQGQVNYVWQPGGLSGSLVVVTQSTNTNYTVTATTSLGCSNTSTLAAEAPTNCCSSPNLPTFNDQIVNISTAYIGPLLITSSFTVLAGAHLILSQGEFILSNTARIVVAAGASLTIQGAHLYSCGADLWQGIVIEDGGKVEVEGNSLIEDAITAIDLGNQTTSTLSSILYVDQAVFNKNYIDINLSQYQKTVTPYPFTIVNTVFTCRDLPFTATAWPSANAGSMLNTEYAELRTEMSSISNLSQPFLTQGGFTVANLKNPYANEPSHIAIKLNDVGLTFSNTVFYGISIGDTTDPALFNLFDSHKEFISADNCNMSLANNRFQNTQRVMATAAPGTVSALYGGAAISSRALYNNMKLELSTGKKFNTSNFFWDCHTGVFGEKLFKVTIERAFFRSTQSTASLPSGTFIPQGNAGIVLNTNRYNYYIRHNWFDNINQAINIPIMAAQMCAGCVNSIYASNIAVLQNTFTASWGLYLGKAINITCPNNVTPVIAPASLAKPYTQAISIESNFINNAFRGIYVNGITGFKTAIENNTITLIDDNYFTPPVQRGIELVNTFGANNSVGQHHISNNEISAQNTTNSNISLVHCSINSGVNSPSITCNHLSNAYNGFVFNSSSMDAVWAGNRMQPLARGLTLEQNGEMGQQGTSNTAANNSWDGGWNQQTNYGTYVGAFSTALLSPMWVKNGNASPLTNFGSVANNLWYGAANTLFPSTGGDYICSENPNNFAVPLPNYYNYDDFAAYYIAHTARTRFLYFNDSVLNSEAAYQEFYDSPLSRRIVLLLEVDNRLYEGDVNRAEFFLSFFYPFISVEDNYKQYYTIYLNVLNGATYTGADSLNLLMLAGLCPAQAGACVYQARALYNALYNKDLIYPDCDMSGLRQGTETHTINKQGSGENKWNVNLFPNPAQNKLSIIGKNESELLKIEIRDINHRIVKYKEIKTSGFIFNLDLDLINGMYFISIKNADNETTYKKLLITK